MARPEDITVGSSVKGIVANDTVTIVAVQWYGTNDIEICCFYHQKKDFISVPYEPKDESYMKTLQ